MISPEWQAALIEIREDIKHGYPHHATTLARLITGWDSPAAELGVDRCQLVPFGWEPDSAPPCVLPVVHDGRDHQNKFGGQWVNPTKDERAPHQPSA